MPDDVQRYSFEGDASSLASAVTKAIDSLGKYQKQLVDLQKSSGAFEKVGAASKVMNSSLKNTGSAFSKMIKNFGDSTKAAGKMTSSLNAVSAAGSLVKASLAAVGTVSLGKLLAESAKESISYVENLNLFNVAMRDSIDVGKQYVATMSEVYGLDPSNVMRHVGLFYQLSAAMEAPQAASEKLSMGLTSMGVDLASIFNMNIEQVMDNLVSGTQGMSRAVRKYGIDIRVTTLQQEAMLLGIKGQVQNMSEADRQGLRYIAMMKQARALQGDFAKTIESPANQLRILVEQMKQFGRAVGNFVVMPLTYVLPYINAVVMALRMLLEGLAALIGFKPLDFGGSVAEETSSAVAGIGSAAEGSAKKLKKMLAPFDELNTISQQTASSGGGGGASASEMLDPKIAKAMEELEYKMLSIEMKANKVRDAILSFAGLSFDIEGKIVYNPGVFEDNLKNKFPQWAQTITAIFKNWTPILQGLGDVLNAVLGVATEASKPIKEMFSGNNLDERFANFLNDLPTKLQTISDWINNNREPLARIAQIVGAVALAFTAWNLVAGPLSAALTILLPVISFLATPVGLLVGAVAALAAGFAYLWTTNEQFRESVQQVASAIGERLAPIVSYLKEQVVSVFEILKKAWETNGKPALDAFLGYMEKLKDTFQLVWDTTLEPIITNLGKIIGELWEKHFKPALGSIMGFIWSVSEAMWGFASVLLDVANYAIKFWGPAIAFLFNGIADIVGIAIGAVMDIIQSIITVLKGVMEFLSGVFTGDWDRAWEGIKTITIGIIGGIGSIFSNGWEQIKKGFQIFSGIFKGTWTTFWNGLKDIFQGIVDKISSIFSGVMDTVKGVIDSVKNFKLPDIFGGTGGGGGGKASTAFQSTMTIPKFASGGFPDMGQLFIAREAGAELVGKVGGDTAVMNNDQIVAAVSAGVANAVKGVLGNANKSGGDSEYSLVIDSIEFGRIVKKSVNDLQRQTGVAAFQL